MDFVGSPPNRVHSNKQKQMWNGEREFTHQTFGSFDQNATTGPFQNNQTRTFSSDGGRDSARDTFQNSSISTIRQRYTATIPLKQDFHNQSNATNAAQFQESRLMGSQNALYNNYTLNTSQQQQNNSTFKKEERDFKTTDFALNTNYSQQQHWNNNDNTERYLSPSSRADNNSHKNHYQHFYAEPISQQLSTSQATIVQKGGTGAADDSFAGASETIPTKYAGSFQKQAPSFGGSSHVQNEIQRHQEVPVSRYTYRNNSFDMHSVNQPKQSVGQEQQAPFGTLNSNQYAGSNPKAYLKNGGSVGLSQNRNDQRDERGGGGSIYSDSQVQASLNSQNDTKQRMSFSANAFYPQSHHQANNHQRHSYDQNSQSLNQSHQQLLSPARQKIYEKDINRAVAPIQKQTLKENDSSSQMDAYVRSLDSGILEKPVSEQMPHYLQIVNNMCSNGDLDSADAATLKKELENKSSMVLMIFKFFLQSKEYSFFLRRLQNVVGQRPTTQSFMSGKGAGSYIGSSSNQTNKAPTLQNYLQQQSTDASLQQKQSASQFQPQSSISVNDGSRLFRPRVDNNWADQTAQNLEQNSAKMGGQNHQSHFNKFHNSFSDHQKGSSVLATNHSFLSHKPSLQPGLLAQNNQPGNGGSITPTPTGAQQEKMGGEFRESLSQKYFEDNQQRDSTPLSNHESQLAQLEQISSNFGETVFQEQSRTPLSVDSSSLNRFAQMGAATTPPAQKIQPPKQQESHAQSNRYSWEQYKENIVFSGKKEEPESKVEERRFTFGGAYDQNKPLREASEDIIEGLGRSNESQKAQYPPDSSNYNKISTEFKSGRPSEPLEVQRATPNYRPQNINVQEHLKLKNLTSGSSSGNRPVTPPTLSEILSRSTTNISRPTAVQHQQMNTISNDYQAANLKSPTQLNYNQNTTDAQQNTTNRKKEKSKSSRRRKRTVLDQKESFKLNVNQCVQSGDQVEMYFPPRAIPWQHAISCLEDFGIDMTAFKTTELPPQNVQNQIFQASSPRDITPLHETRFGSGIVPRTRQEENVSSDSHPEIRQDTLNAIANQSPSGNKQIFIDSQQARDYDFAEMGEFKDFNTLIKRVQKAFASLRYSDLVYLLNILKLQSSKRDGFGMKQESEAQNEIADWKSDIQMALQVANSSSQEYSNRGETSQFSNDLLQLVLLCAKMGGVLNAGLKFSHFVGPIVLISQQKQLLSESNETKPSVQRLAMTCVEHYDRYFSKSVTVGDSACPDKQGSSPQRQGRRKAYETNSQTLFNFLSVLMVLAEKNCSQEIAKQFREAVEDRIMGNMEDGTLIFTDQISQIKNQLAALFGKQNQSQVSNQKSTQRFADFGENENEKDPRFLISDNIQRKVETFQDDKDQNRQIFSDSKPLKRDQRAGSSREDLRPSVCVQERGQERPLPMTLELQNKRQTVLNGGSKTINRSQTAQPKKGILKKSSSSSNIKLPRKQPVSFKGLRGKEGSSGKKVRERDALINSQKMLQNGGSLKFYNDEIQRLTGQRNNFEGSQDLPKFTHSHTTKASKTAQISQNSQKLLSTSNKLYSNKNSSNIQQRLGINSTKSNASKSLQIALNGGQKRGEIRTSDKSGLKFLRANNISSGYPKQIQSANSHSNQSSSALSFKNGTVQGRLNANPAPTSALLEAYANQNVRRADAQNGKISQSFSNLNSLGSPYNNQTSALIANGTHSGSGKQGTSSHSSLLMLNSSQQIDRASQQRLATNDVGTFRQGRISTPSNQSIPLNRAQNGLFSASAVRSQSTQKERIGVDQQPHQFTQNSFSAHSVKQGPSHLNDLLSNQFVNRMQSACQNSRQAPFSQTWTGQSNTYDLDRPRSANNHGSQPQTSAFNVGNHLEGEKYQEPSPHEQQQLLRQNQNLNTFSGGMDHNVSKFSVTVDDMVIGKGEIGGVGGHHRRGNSYKRESSGYLVDRRTSDLSYQRIP